MESKDKDKDKDKNLSQSRESSELEVGIVVGRDKHGSIVVRGLSPLTPGIAREIDVSEIFPLLSYATLLVLNGMLSTLAQMCSSRIIRPNMADLDSTIPGMSADFYKKK